MKIDSEAVGDISALKAGNNIDIVHITYDAVAGHISSSDTEFSRRSIQLQRRKSENLSQDQKSQTV
ncbi:DUF3734 domain-containing protein [Photobacterium sagamiensis]|uniref:DUF3734 domain-containing protein n=1 Tax=Photobacterium sagamiensis TaxID=2910241 RepID=UPI003D153598